MALSCLLKFFDSFGTVSPIGVNSWDVIPAKLLTQVHNRLGLKGIRRHGPEEVTIDVLITQSYTGRVVADLRDFEDTKKICNRHWHSTPRRSNYSSQLHFGVFMKRHFDELFGDIGRDCFALARVVHAGPKCDVWQEVRVRIHLFNGKQHSFHLLVAWYFVERTTSILVCVALQMDWKQSSQNDVSAYFDWILNAKFRTFWSRIFLMQTDFCDILQISCIIESWGIRKAS